MIHGKERTHDKRNESCSAKVRTEDKRTVIYCSDPVRYLLPCRREASDFFKISAFVLRQGKGGPLVSLYSTFYSKSFSEDG